MTEYYKENEIDWHEIMCDAIAEAELPTDCWKYDLAKTSSVYLSKLKKDRRCRDGYRVLYVIRLAEHEEKIPRPWIVNIDTSDFFSRQWTNFPDLEELDYCRYATQEAYENLELYGEYRPGMTRDDLVNTLATVLKQQEKGE